jgi:hypothetical protein
VNIQAGEFIYLWIPGVGEKPFSALVDDPFTLVVIDVGQFTHALMELHARQRGLRARPPRRARGAAGGRAHHGRGRRYGPGGGLSDRPGLR